jgi:hypothetical protein
MFPIPQNFTQRHILGMWFLLRDPKRWTKGAYARDAYFGSTPARGSAARCFCEMGAAIRMAGDNDAHVYVRPVLQRALPDHAPSYSVGEFNDLRTTSHKDILAHLTRAYALAGQIVFNH